jgi:hypothetical protein
MGQMGFFYESFISDTASRRPADPRKRPRLDDALATIIIVRDAVLISMIETDLGRSGVTA